MASIIVNTTKTKSLKIGTKSNTTFKYGEQSIENVNIYKYLGHILNVHKSTHNKMPEYLTTTPIKQSLHYKVKLNQP